MPTVHLDLIEGRQATKSTKLNVNQGQIQTWLSVDLGAR